MDDRPVSPPNLAREKRADLRRRLPELLREAASSDDAKSAALLAALKIGAKVPPDLLTSTNVAKSLQPREVARSLQRLSASTITLDLSAALDAIRESSAPRLAQDRRLSRDLTQTVTKQLLELSSRSSGRAGGVRSKPVGALPVRFTIETVRAAADLARTLLVAIATSKRRKSDDLHSLAVRWLDAIEAVWQGAPPAATLTMVKFERALWSGLAPAPRAQLRNDAKVAKLLESIRSATLAEAETALREGRVDVLEGLLRAVGEDPEEQGRIVFALQELCRGHPFDIQPHAIEWVAHRVGGLTREAMAPVAADESQSSALDVVSLALLATWDAISEGTRSAEAFERVRDESDHAYQWRGGQGM
jgi:hypothetical protein